MPVLEAIENAQEQITDTLGSVQTRLVETNQKVVDTNKKIIGQLNDRIGDRVPEMPSIPVVSAVASRIPSPTVAVSGYFDLVERATKANRKFALDLVGAWAPAATKPAAKKAAAKPAAKKTAAKKTAAAKPAAKKAAAPTTAAATKEKDAVKKVSTRTVAKAVSTDND